MAQLERAYLRRLKVRNLAFASTNKRKNLLVSDSHFEHKYGPDPRPFQSASILAYAGLCKPYAGYAIVVAPVRL